MILYIDSNSNPIRVDGAGNGINEDYSNVIYFETYEAYETALTNGEIDADTLITIKSSDDVISGGSSETITVDSTLSSTSENPVQSKVINEKFNEVTTMINNLTTSLGTQMTFTLNGTDLVIKTL